MASIQPYKIAVPQDKLDILKKKLDLATFPDELEDVEWGHGPPLADIKRLTAYWRDNYDWRKAEAKLNEFPQFIADIVVDGYETFKVHFIHQKSEVKNAIPLIFVHGWPGSFDEVSRILPELVKGGKDTPAFHVVAPSLVNFGFSEGTKKV
jgi:pimeloyl-ACP methyl ester carboxylesterase